MEKPLRVAVVGVGAVSLRGVIAHLAEPDLKNRVELVALCDPAEARAEEAAHRFGVERVFASYDDLLAADVVDAVTLATPIGIHYEQGRKAILAGKHVHFNKTMTVTAAEATDLIDLARERSVKLVASPGEMLRPHNRAIRRMIREGRIGIPVWAICGAAFGNYHNDEAERSSGSQTSIDPSWYFRKPGGGPLYDMTVYALHGLTGILGPAQRVTALSGVRIPERSFAGRTIPTEADDNTLMLLDFGQNLLAVVYGTAAGGIRDELDFSGTYFGTAGTIAGLKLNGEPFDYEGRAEATSAPDGGVNPGFGGNEWILPNIDGAHKAIPEQHIHADFMQLVDCVRDDTPSIASAEHARHVIEIIEQAFRSAETGQTQALTTPFPTLD